MDGSLVSAFEGDIGEVDVTGWKPKAGLSYQKWYDAMQELFAAQSSLNWLIGDGLNFGEVRFGEAYAQVAELTGWSYQHAADMKWVAGKVPHHVRSANLSWTHHRIVAALKSSEQQQMWLRRAEVNEWSTAQLRRAMRGLPAVDDEPEPLVLKSPQRTAVVLASEMALLSQQSVSSWLNELTVAEQETARETAHNMIGVAVQVLEWLDDSPRPTRITKRQGEYEQRN